MYSFRNGSGVGDGDGDCSAIILFDPIDPLHGPTTPAKQTAAVSAISAKTISFRFNGRAVWAVCLFLRFLLGTDASSHDLRNPVRHELRFLLVKD
jgi:hypothetical protein